MTHTHTNHHKDECRRHHPVSRMGQACHVPPSARVRIAHSPTHVVIPCSSHHLRPRYPLCTFPGEGPIKLGLTLDLAPTRHLSHLMSSSSTSSAPWLCLCRLLATAEGAAGHWARAGLRPLRRPRLEERPVARPYHLHSPPLASPSHSTTQHCMVGSLTFFRLDRFPGHSAASPP